MSVGQLIAQAKSIHAKHGFVEKRGVDFFTNGAVWMHRYLSILCEDVADLAEDNYEFLGYAKYIFSFLIAALSIGLLPIIGWWFVLFSIVLFYLAEVHFLFLFPLAIKGEVNLIKEVVFATYKLGFFKSFYYTIVIAVFMLLGLFRFNNPLHNWRVGCLSILILYKSEIRDRK